MRLRAPCKLVSGDVVLAMSLALSLLALALPARAAVPEAYRVRARVERGEGRVSAHVSVRVRLAEGEDHVRFWLYPDRTAETPAAMNERSWRWIYPGEVDRGGVEVEGARVDGAVLSRADLDAGLEHRPAGEPRGRDTAGTDLVIRVPPGPARSVEIALDVRARVPDRFGRLGRANGLLSLAAPWYPLVVSDDDAFLHRVPHHVAVALDEGELLVADRAFGREAEVDLETEYVTLAAAADFHELVVPVEGIELVLRSSERMYAPPPPDRRGDGGLPDLARVDVARLIRDVAAEAIASARAFGVPVPSRIVLAPIPSRTELVANAPGLVLFSDHLFQIFPIDQTLDFHRRALRRALFAFIAAPLAAVDPVADRSWVTDLRAVVLVDLDEARRHHGAQTPQEMLQLFAFHPAVDQLLYAPQIAFEDAYFAAIEERDPFRDDPVRARRPLSRGRRILEMARDALPAPAFSRFVAMLVHARRPARVALARAAPERASRLPSWLAATGEPVNYRLGERRSERLPDGSRRHTIEIHRDGATRAEPVEVLVEDGAGHRVTAVWDGPGPRGEVVVEMPGEISGVTIDPRARLPQDPRLADGHPRIDDATDVPWRPPILNGFLFNVYGTEGDFTGLLDFALRRRYDLEHTIGLRLERTRAFTGGTIRYSQGVGPKIHTNRRMGALTAGLSFERLHELFGDGDLGGWRSQISLSGSFNTVQYALDPREGFWGAAAVTGGMAFRDDGTLGLTLRGGVRGGMILPLGLVNALAVIVGGGFTAGDALLSELQGIGGADRLRGFESGELLGRGSLYAVVEHRWSALRDLSWNLAHLVWVREIQLAIFAGAGASFDTVSSNGEPLDAAGAADVGAGVRVHYEYGGVQPGLISIDVGIPLTRTDDGVYVDGELVRRRAPVGFYIGFDQFF
jgi:hypothetical protein